MILHLDRRRQLTVAVALGMLLAASASLGPWVGTASADSRIARITKDSLYGAGLGLLLGAVTALVVDKDSRDDSIRWGVVLGTFAGFSYGIYSAAAGNDDDFFLTVADASTTGTDFDPRVHFVGTHGSWTVETSGDAVHLPSGLLSERESHFGDADVATLPFASE